MKALFILTIISFSTFIQKPKSKDYYFEKASIMTTVDERHLTDSVCQVAITYYTKAINIDGKFWQGYRNRARLYMRLNKLNDAILDLKMALRSTNNTDPYLRSNLGQCYYGSGNYTLALSNFNIAIKEIYAKQYLLYWIAKTKWKLNRKVEACKDYHLAKSLDPNLDKEDDEMRCNCH